MKQLAEFYINQLSNMGKNKILVIILYFFCLSSNAQDKAFYWIELTDKSTSTHSVSSPETFLTQKAIDRRNRQNIAISNQDLPVPKSYIDAINAFVDVEIHNTSRWMNAVLIKTDNQSSLNQIKALSFVKSSDSIQLSGLKSQETYRHKMEEPDFGKKSQISNVDLIYGSAFNQIHMHNGEVLHEKGNWGENMTIGVIDAGFTGAQANLSLSNAFLSNQVLGTRNFIENSNDVYKNSTHGTYVFTTIAGNLTGDYVGTCPNASYWLLMSEDVASESIIEEYYWLFAAEYADSVGVDVLNTSLGYTEFDDPTQNHTYADMDGNTTIAAIASDIAASKGILLFNSNGNSGNNAWTYLGTPADADSVIAVGATDSSGIIASFSSLGPSSDGDIKPNIAGQGAPSALYHNDGYVVYGNGTSFSSPILCGLGTCLWQAFPDKTNMEIKDIIERSSHIYQSPDDFYGYGIPDFSEAYELLRVEDNTLNNIEVFPSYFHNQFSIQYSNQINALDIQMFDNIGKLHYQKKLIINTNQSANTLNVSPLFLPKGIYHIVITDDNNNQFKKKLIKY